MAGRSYAFNLESNTNTDRDILERRPSVYQRTIRLGILIASAQIVRDMAKKTKIKMKKYL
jgi:RNA polymerase-interacting CarD/CdnL/TRCF family regulator